MTKRLLGTAKVLLPRPRVQINGVFLSISARRPTSRACGGDRSDSAASPGDKATTQQIDQTLGSDDYTPPAEVYTPEAPEPTEPEAPPIASLTVKDQGWSTYEEYVLWGAVIHNPGADQSLADVTATAIDADGDALDTDTDTFFRIPGNSDYYVGGTFIDAQGVKKVEVSLEDGNNYLEHNNPIDGGLKATSAKLIGYDYDFKVSLAVTSTLPVSTQTGLPISMVFRNSAGRIVGGANEYLQRSVPPGGTVRTTVGAAMIRPRGAVRAQVSFDVSDSHLNAA